MGASRVCGEDEICFNIMLNFSSSCGALQLINTNTILLIFFLYTAKITLSRTLLRTLPFTLFLFFSFSLVRLSQWNAKSTFSRLIRPRVLDYKHYPPLVLIHIIYFSLALFSAKHPPNVFRTIGLFFLWHKTSKTFYIIYKCILISVWTISFFEKAHRTIFTCCAPSREEVLKFASRRANS